MKGTIKLNREFRYAYRKGKKVVSDLVILHYYANRTNENKLGITVSTSIGNAVTRNRVKRYMREAFRIYKDRIKTGYNIVIVARNKTAYSNFDSIKFCMKECIENSGLMI